MLKHPYRESVQLGKFESIAFFAARLTRGTVIIIFFVFNRRVRITVEKQAPTV